MTSHQSTTKKFTESWYTVKTVHGTALCWTTEKMYQPDWKSCIMCTHLHKMMQYGWCCGWLPTRCRCVSPWPYPRMYWSSFLIGTTASEYVTAWRQWHDAHVMVLVVVLCTIENQHALVRILKLVQSSLSQCNVAKRSKKKMDAYK